MGKVETVDFKTCKRNNYKVLLFADNREHMALLKRIQRSAEWRDHYVGRWHTETDEDNREIIKGQGKKHCHLLLVKPDSPVHWSAVCKRLDADPRFLRPVGVAADGDYKKRETLKGGYQYLCHINKPEKGILNPSGLFGAPHLIQDAMQAICEGLAKNVSMAGAVGAVSEWVHSQNGIISARDLVKYLASTPYFKAQQSRLTYMLVDEHNDRLRRAAAAEKACRDADAKAFAAERECIVHYSPPPDYEVVCDEYGCYKVGAGYECL